MSHWDVRPGESVELIHGNALLFAAFRFRDTVHACFDVETARGIELRQFMLTEGGTGVYDVNPAWPEERRVWLIRHVDRVRRPFLVGTAEGGPHVG